MFIEEAASLDSENAVCMGSMVVKNYDLETMDAVCTDETISTILMFNNDYKLVAFKIKSKSESLVQTRTIMHA